MSGEALPQESAVMQETVLFIDDSKLILAMVRDLFAEAAFTVLTCEEPEAALRILQDEEIAVVVTDNVMPKMSGLDLLSSLGRHSPDTVKVLMSAHADLASALVAINRSEVFRYLLKPWQPDELTTVVSEALQRYRLVKSMRREDEAILRSLAQTIELKDPSTRGHCDRVAVYALLIAESLGLPKGVQREIKYGSWLHDCGKIGVSEDILNGPGKLTAAELAVMKQHPLWGADVAAKANLSVTTCDIIRHHHEYYDGNGYPTGLRGEEIPLAARIVAVADVFDALSSKRSYRADYPPERAVEILGSMSGTILDPRLVELFLGLLAAHPEYPLHVES
jgi:response regulator RpfG family c-di-GMP phosphodiesterase